MRARIRVGSLAGLLSASLLYAQVIITPELRTGAGYDSNRYRSRNNEEADGFLEATPALKLSWFASEAIEWNASLQHRRRTYLSTANGRLDTTEGEAGFSWLKEGFDAELFVGGGSFEDSELPYDDVQWLHLAPFIGYTFFNGLQISLRAYISRDEYDSRLTFEGDAENGRYGVIRPGFSWPASMNLTLWAEVYAEQFTANEPVDEYNGFGATAGLDYDLIPSFRLSGSARAGIRDYPNDIPELVESRTDTPFGMEISGRYRLTDWLTLQAAGYWNSLPSTNEDSEYDQWTVLVGLTIAQDFTSD